MICINMENLEYTDEGIYTYQGIPFCGFGIEYYENGQLQSEISYRDGIENGITREWFSNGQLECENQIVNGGKHGRCQEWFESGRLKNDSLYEFGILTKKKQWDETGKLVQEFEISEHDNLYSTLLLFRETNKMPKE